MIGALILTGGASSRMGRDKATLEVGGVRAVDRLAGLASEVGASTVLTVGGRSHGRPHVEDPVPLGGPVGGIAVGVARLAAEGCIVVLVLAVDAPTLQPGDLAPLIESPQGAAFADQPLPLVAPVARFPAEARSDWPVARLVSAWGLARLAPPVGATDRLRGANTPEEYQRLVQAFAAEVDAMR